MPMVNEANAMSEELKKGVRFEIVLISPQSRGLKHGRTQVITMGFYNSIPFNSIEHLYPQLHMETST